MKSVAAEAKKCELDETAEPFNISGKTCADVTVAEVVDELKKQNKNPVDKTADVIITSGNPGPGQVKLTSSSGTLTIASCAAKKTKGDACPTAVGSSSDKTKEFLSNQVDVNGFKDTSW